MRLASNLIIRDGGFNVAKSRVPDPRRIRCTPRFLLNGRQEQNHWSAPSKERLLSLEIIDKTLKSVYSNIDKTVNVPIFEIGPVRRTHRYSHATPKAGNVSAVEHLRNYLFSLGRPFGGVGLWNQFVLRPAPLNKSLPLFDVLG